MSKTITVTEMSRNLAEYMNQVAYRRESFRITRGNKEIAELRPVQKGLTGSELLDLFNSLPRLSPEDAEALAKDYYDIKASEPVEDYDPWER